jgi:4-hydroxyacetophenone monooxygenase
MPAIFVAAPASSAAYRRERMATNRRDRSVSANQAHLPITESDEELAKLVSEVSPLLLALSCVHMSGNLDLIRAGVKTSPPAFNGDTSGSIADADAQMLRARGLEVIKAYRDAGCPEPYRPTDPELQEMIDFLMGLEMPPSYLPLIREDMSFDSPDDRAFRWTKPVSEGEKARVPTVIIGAGMSGMLLGMRLKQAGLPFVILEKTDGVGGTWYRNRYPGLRVDVPSHAYSYSFIQDHKWSHLYSWQPDLLDYFRECFERFDIADHVRFNVEVTGADWDESNARWRVRACEKNGTPEEIDARVLVSASGFFNLPHIPAFEGADQFKGDKFHTSEWRHDVDLAGKNVAVIGNAATALQLIPPVAEVAGRLTVFQRAPSWTFVNPEYAREIRTGEQWAIDHLPFYSGWMRAAVFNWTLDLFPLLMGIDPEWPQDGRSTSALNELSRQKALADYHAHLADRPDLLQKLVPDYPPYVKRPTIGSGNFFDAIKRDNVELVTEPIVSFTADGIVDAAGQERPFDVVVYATGYRVQEYLAPMTIHGRGGVELNAFWKDRPGGYLGMTVPNFPNFYMMYGPGNNLGYNGNLIFSSELQANYIAGCLRFMVENGRDELEVREDKFDEYMERTSRKLEEFVWSTSYGTSYFRNESGRVTTNTPWSLLEMWQWTRQPDPNDFREPPSTPHRAATGGRVASD